MDENQEITPEKTDFTLSEKELENVAGGAGCGEIGGVGMDCTKTGFNSNCGEIGAWGSECTKTGIS